MKYKHFSIEEREKIQEMLWQKKSIRDIAIILGAFLFFYLVTGLGKGRRRIGLK